MIVDSSIYIENSKSLRARDRHVELIASVLPLRLSP